MGPQTTRPEDAAACSNALNGGSRSFYAASRLLPGQFARDATALYAFCRLADDLIDDCEVGSSSIRERGTRLQIALTSLHQRLNRIYEGVPFADPADRAMRHVVAQHHLPKALFGALFEGFEWDASQRQYETIDDVFDYGARVAGSVGVMMALLMGVRGSGMLSRAADLGLAMQLTNIARDVGEDARNGRLYLPRLWLREEGMNPDDFLANPRFGLAIGRVVERLLCVADKLYVRADSGLVRLPKRYRPGMMAARILYSSIGDEIRRQNFDSVSRRAVVSPSAKARALGGLPRLLMQGSPHLDAPAQMQMRYLVRIAALGCSNQPAVNAKPASAAASVVWVLNLFDELDRRKTSTRITRSHRLPAAAPLR